MVNFSTQKRKIILSLVFALCLCSTLFIASLGVKVYADDVVTYEIIGIKPEDNQTANDNFYALTTTHQTNFGCNENSWEIWYSGPAKKYDASENTTTDTTVNFRIVANKQSRELFFTGLGAETGDIYTVDGIYNIDHFEPTYTGAVQVGDYVLKLAKTSFGWNGTSWELAKEKVDEASDNVFLDMNGSDASIVGQFVRFNADFQGWFGAPGNVNNINVCFPANAVAENEAVTVELGKKYKAENYSAIKVKVLVAMGEAADTTTSAYKNAASTEVAGSVLSKTQETILLEIDPAKVADEDGYIDSFVIKRTGSAGQFFFDCVELVVDKKDDTAYKQNVVLGINGTDVEFTNGYHNADVNGFWDETHQKVIGVMDNTGNNTVMIFTLATKYKAANFESVTIEYVVSDWTSVDNQITMTAYALSDTDCVTPLASHTVNGSANTNDSLTIPAAALADSEGYIKGIILKKTQTVNEGSCTWQFFANEVTLNVPAYTMTVKDGENTATHRVVKGESFAVANIGAVNSATQIVAGYKINGKLYSADYSFTPSADTEIEVVRIAFKVKDGGSVKYIGDMGLRFTALMSATEYNALKAMVSEENISFGMDLTKVSTNKTVSKTAVKYYTNDNGEISYNGLILNIPTTAYEEEFAAKAYLEIKFEDKESAVKVYAIANNNTSSVYKAAKSALTEGATGTRKTVCEQIVDAVESAETNLPDYEAKKKC